MDFLDPKRFPLSDWIDEASASGDGELTSKWLPHHNSKHFCHWWKLRVHSATGQPSQRGGPRWLGEGTKREG